MPKKAKDFVFSGKEVFKLDKDKKGAQGEGKQPIVLNIDEDDVVLSEKGKKILGKEQKVTDTSSGFFLIDWYKKINRYFLLHTKIKDDEKANFFHLLSVMINAGVPVIKSLKSLLGQVDRDSHMHMVLSDLLAKIEEGRSLSEAMSFHEEFSEMEVGMIESGEAAGQLNKTLDNLAIDLARRQDTKHKIKSALMYPIAIIMLLIVVMIVMMVFIIPKLTALFERSAEGLPLITRIVVAISDFMIGYGWVLLGFVLILGLVVSFGKKTKQGAFWFGKFKLGVPVFGKLFQMTYLARFARSIANLMASGVPIVKTLEITATAVGNEVYKRRVLLTAEDMKQGIPLAENLADPKLFPPMLVNMAEVGEKTAQLDTIMLKIADYYEEDVATSVKGLAKIIEPVILIVIGVSVGVIVAAVMLPIMQLSDVAGGL
jgi:type IV pilus assembly protein PilC